MTITPITKVCTICCLPKPTDQFTKHLGHRDKLGSNCRTCRRDLARARERRLRETKPPKIKPPKPQVKKIKAPVDPKLIVDCPGIFEVQNRGRGYTSFNFTSPIDGSTFSFSSFKEARQARQEMMDAFRQQSRFDAVVRQSTGKKRAVDESDA